MLSWLHRTNTERCMSHMPYPPLSQYLDLLLDTVCVVDRDGHFVYVSPSCEQTFGYRQEEMLGRQMLDLMHPEDHERTLRTVERINAGEHLYHFENRYIRKNGDVVHIMWSARRSETDQNRVAVARDITQRKRAEMMQQAVFAIAEASHNCASLDSLYAEIYQILNQLLPARHCSLALYDGQQLSFPFHVDAYSQAPASAALAPDSIYQPLLQQGQALLLDAAQIAACSDPEFQRASQLPYTWLALPLNSQGNTLGALVIRNYADPIHDYSRDLELLQFVCSQIAVALERHQMLADLRQCALYDQLTALPNRRLFGDRMHSALARAKRQQQQLALLFIDLDKFKEVNDRLGHSQGDLLLASVARRLEASLRECDTVARFGGDEFVVLLENIDQPEQVDAIVAKIAANLHQPYELRDSQGQHRVQIIASIGLSLFPRDGDSEESLLRHADRSMYRQKNDPH